ncbi:TPA: hypothetical protein NBM92_005830 [Klebsiella oxytoca]|nr:hypothetical protein [Klebsiella oxytoca]
MFYEKKEHLTLLASDCYSFITIESALMDLFEENPRLRNLNILVNVFSEKNLPDLAHTQISKNFYDLHIIIASETFYRVISGSVSCGHLFHIDISLSVFDMMMKLRQIFEYSCNHASKLTEIQRFQRQLTQHESLYIEMLLSEKKNRKIAAATGIPERDISKTKRKLMGYLGVKSTQELFVKILILARSDFFNVILLK